MNLVAYFSRADADAAHDLASTQVFDRTMRAAQDVEVLLHSLVGTLAYESLAAHRSDERSDLADALAGKLRNLANTLDGISRDVRPARARAA